MKLKTNGWHEFAIVIFISAIEDVLIADRYSVLRHPPDMFEFIRGIFAILIGGFSIYLCYKFGEDLCLSHLRGIKQSILGSRILKNRGDTIWQIVTGKGEAGQLDNKFAFATFILIIYPIIIVVCYNKRSIFDTFLDYAKEFSIEFVPRYVAYWIGICLGRKTLNYKTMLENINEKDT